MKTIALIFSLVLLASCNDATRTRIGKCRSSNNKLVMCSNTDALKSEEFRKNYYAEISTPIQVGQSQILFKEYAHDSDHDQELVCDLEIAAGKQFSYAFKERKLILRDGISTLTFIRNSGLETDGLLGTWAMQETSGNQVTKTELTFKDLEEIRIKKTCSLKK